jgi:hypothetical protein
LPLQIIPRELGIVFGSTLLSFLPERFRSYKNSYLTNGLIVNAVGHAVAYPFETVGKILQAQGDELPSYMRSDVRTSSFTTGLKTLYDRDPSRLWSGIPGTLA